MKKIIFLLKSQLNIYFRSLVQYLKSPLSTFIEALFLNRMQFISPLDDKNCRTNGLFRVIN